MKQQIQILLIIGIVFIFNANLKSQSQLIEMPQGSSAVYEQNGIRLTPNQLLEITEVNPEAYKIMQKAKSNISTAQIFGYIGGFLVGYPLGTMIGGGEPEWAMAGIGAGFIGLSIPFSVAYKKHSKHAVAIYNEGINKANTDKLDLSLGCTANGFGLKLMF